VARQYDDEQDISILVGNVERVWLWFCHMPLQRSYRHDALGYLGGTAWKVARWDIGETWLDNAMRLGQCVSQNAMATAGHSHSYYKYCSTIVVYADDPVV